VPNESRTGAEPIPAARQGIGYRSIARRYAGLVVILAVAGIIAPAARPEGVLPLATSPLNEALVPIFGPGVEDAGPGGGNKVAIIESGYDALLLRVHLIRNATRSIVLQTYFWAGDECSRLLGRELVRAAERGVKIRVLVDGISPHENERLVAFDQKVYPNIEIKIYRPLAHRIHPSITSTVLSLMVPMGAHQRMHNKLMVVDDAVGLTGGRNIGNDYFNYSTGFNFIDREALVVGPEVYLMAKSFEDFWSFKKAIPNTELKDVGKRNSRGISPPPPTRAEVGLNDEFAQLDRDANDPAVVRQRFVDTLRPVQNLYFVADTPGVKTRFYFFSPKSGGRVTEVFRQYVEGSREELLMQSPYTILNRRMRQSFHSLLKRAPDLHITLSTNSLGSADQVATYASNYRLRTKLIRRLQFHVFEMKLEPEMRSHYLPNFDELVARAAAEGLKREPYLSIHAKTYVFDRRVTFIGSYNLDPRSAYINSECGVFIEDAGIAGQVRESLLRDMAPENSWVIARKQGPLGGLNRVVELAWSILPIDLWPFRYTTSFELLPGEDPVSSDDPRFYLRYKDIGGFPGGEGMNAAKMTIQMHKIFGKTGTPLL